MSIVDNVKKDSYYLRRKAVDPDYLKDKIRGDRSVEGKIYYAKRKAKDPNYARDRARIKRATDPEYNIGMERDG